MKQPTVEFLIQLSCALREAEHRNVAEHFAAGLLWALYPEWFDKHFTKNPTVDDVIIREYENALAPKKGLQRKSAKR